MFKTFELPAPDAKTVHSMIDFELERHFSSGLENLYYTYQINQKLLNATGKNSLVMHCLPAHRGMEITSEVLDGKDSIVFDQAENRLHVQKAILETLLSQPSQ